MPKRNTWLQEPVKVFMVYYWQGEEEKVTVNRIDLSHSKSPGSVDWHVH